MEGYEGGRKVGWQGEGKQAGNEGDMKGRREAGWERGKVLRREAGR